MNVSDNFKLETGGRWPWKENDTDCQALGVFGRKLHWSQGELSVKCFSMDFHGVDLF